MPRSGIEPASTALQAAAVTRSASGAKGGIGHPAAIALLFDFQRTDGATVVCGSARTRTAFRSLKRRGFTGKVSDPYVPPTGLEPAQSDLKDRCPSRRAPAADVRHRHLFSLHVPSEGCRGIEPREPEASALQAPLSPRTQPRNAEGRLGISSGRPPRRELSRINDASAALLIAGPRLVGFEAWDRCARRHAIRAHVRQRLDRKVPAANRAGLQPERHEIEGVRVFLGRQQKFYLKRRFISVERYRR